MTTDQMAQTTTCDNCDDGSARANHQDCDTAQCSEAQPEAKGATVSNQDATHEVLKHREQVLQAIDQRREDLLSTEGPALANRPLLDLNTEAAKYIKAGDPTSAAAIYTILFTKAARQNITHPDLYICHSNCSAACLALQLYDEALRHAEQCRQLAERSLRRTYKASSGYIKSFERKGNALLGLGRHREAAAAFEAGLKMDAFSLGMKRGLEAANKGMVADLVEGRGMETRAITFPDPAQRISYHPYSAPLHRVRTEDELPVKLLTPFQAENDHHIKDTYNYVTVQTDIEMPKRQILALQDSEYTTAFRHAIEQAVADIEGQDKDCRVLNLGAGAGLHAAMALQAGALHVTAVERWLYLALTCKETLVKNEFSEDRFKVVYKRPTDVELLGDVPVACNLLIANIFDEGLLTSGIIPAAHHALSHLLLPDAVLLPASATVYAQAVELRTNEVCGLDMSAANLYRWRPAYATGVPLDANRIKPLSEPVEVWYFDLGAPPEKSAVKTVDVEFTKDGRFNAVMFWFTLHLYGDVYLSTAPVLSSTGSAPPKWLQPAVQYMAGELRVEAGQTLPLIASHNTVRMRFDIETAEYLHLMKPDASFPHHHFAMLADDSRLQAYQRAIQRAVRRVTAQHGEAHVLDMGTGTGVLALLAAKAGAASVVACDLHASLCDIARKAAASNGCADRVSVVHRDVGLLQRGKEVRPLGVNLVVADMFDAGLFGDQFPYLLELTRKKVVQPGAVTVPAAATMYCMGIEILTGEVEGLNMSELNKYRWDAGYEALRLDSVPHRRLTAPVKVLDHAFDGEKKARGREGLLKLPVVAAGMMNAVAFWFDLHLDEEETITNAPSGIARGGVLLTTRPPPEATEDISPPSTPSTTSTSEVPPPEPPHYWGQALQYLDRAVQLTPGTKATLIARRDGAKLSFSLRQGVGEWVGRAPWKIEWGGGASVENPHFQRVHYCELLVRDFLQRVKSARFPSIQKDMGMVLAHCGSLALDPAALQRVCHEMVVLERIHAAPEFCPGASLEALTRPPLSLC